MMLYLGFLFYLNLLGLLLFPTSLSTSSYTGDWASIQFLTFDFLLNHFLLARLADFID